MRRRFSHVRGGYLCSVLLIVCAVMLNQRAWAQTTPLAEIARKEAERRKSQPPAAKVYTDKDLPASVQKPVPPSAQADPVAAATGERQATEKTPAEPPRPADTPGDLQKNEAWWKSRIAQAREDLRRNEIFAESLQSRINALTREYALPISGARRIAVGQQRAEAIDELGRVKQDIERGKKLIADIEEEARKAGVPPGWLR